MFDIINEFYSTANKMNIDWYAKGIIFENGSVYSINHDTKLLGRIFEILTEPILQEIADKHGYALEASAKQNYYPDFTFIPPKGANNKIAVDVKTTYRSYDARGNLNPYNFTLGSYASFLRKKDKNITYNYDQYCAHYVIGFVYDRNDLAKSSIRSDADQLSEIPLPYLNLEYFIQEKYKIAGFAPGSGNTENIGTVHSNNIDVFKEGRGPFADLGNEVFEFYWSNYPRYKEANKLYTNQETFIYWVENFADCPDEIRKRIYGSTLINSD